MKALIKDKDEKKVINYTTVEETPFTIVQHGDEYIIAIGNHKASDKVFDSLESAKKYISVKDWDLIGSVIVRIVDYLIKEQKNKENENS